MVHHLQPGTVTVTALLASNCAPKLTQSCQKQGPHVPCQPSAPNFLQFTPAIFSSLSFERKLYNLPKCEWSPTVSFSRRPKPNCWTMHPADTSLPSYESCQAVTALMHTRLIFSFTFLFIHRFNLHVGNHSASQGMAEDQERLLQQQEQGRASVCGREERWPRV